ncbi:hypothetical protein [Jiangella asiatica]|uniref:CopG family transcriptional regulator n=1 Tax=Jiangella asiatica TaxID=2530372 RepID=A0A4R5DLG8_9ACTN|nr:hypothetical protein [Jiangella asiatica]TDE15082.1 hypothetical protein E1269_02975 [Jiangella asiatica]
MGRHVVDIEAEASELSRDMDVPADATPSRPGRATVLSVRRGKDEAEQLAALAAERSIPVSTLARSLIVDALRTSTRGPGDVAVHDAVVRALREPLRPDILAAS